MQVRQLRAKLELRHVKIRKANGADLHYVEGWHVIAEANRIFGYDAWDRQTLASRCVWSGVAGAYHEAAYTAKVRVSVRAGDVTIVREGSGSGEAKAATPGHAHDLALKGAETDATKRALATFGNPFGLALYDREQVGVRKTRGEKAVRAIGPWALRSAEGAEEASFDRPNEFAAALRKAMRETPDIELLFPIWEQNVETVRDLNRSLKQQSLPRSEIAPQLVAHLKNCAVGDDSPLAGVSIDLDGHGHLFALATRSILCWHQRKQGIGSKLGRETSQDPRDQAFHVASTRQGTSSEVAPLSLTSFCLTR
jgi:Rad52/22 family double-strand break repair protein